MLMCCEQNRSLLSLFIVRDGGVDRGDSFASFTFHLYNRADTRKIKNILDYDDRRLIFNLLHTFMVRHGHMGHGMNLHSYNRASVIFSQFDLNIWMTSCWLHSTFYGERDICTGHSNGKNPFWFFFSKYILFAFKVKPTIKMWSKRMLRLIFFSINGQLASAQQKFTQFSQRNGNGDWELRER